jgi:Tol biopolymer transport system component
LGADPDFGAAWAPNGQELVYVKDKELHIGNSDGAEVRRLCVVTGTPSSPSWSPDGSRIRFDVQDAPLSTSIWEVSRAGTNLHALLPGWRTNYCCGVWAAGGRYFVFSSEGNIWAIREKTGLFQRVSREPVQLTTGPMYLESPVPSPDGKRLFAAGLQLRTGLVRYDPKSGQFVPYLGGISAEGLDFSRDGNWVAYVRFPEGTLWRAKADGSEPQQLTAQPLMAGFPRWSPDDKQIAFQGKLPGKSERIYLISSDGGTPQQVTNGESGATGDYDASWSPDGSSLAFGAIPDARGVYGHVVIHVLETKTRGISSLPGTDGLWSPHWSANGSYIATLKGSSEKVVLYDFRTHEQIELARGVIGNPSWSRDGAFVYFDTLGSDPAFFRVSIRDRKLERIVSLKDVRRNLGTFEPWTGVAPDGSLLLQRDAEAGEIYAFDWDAP